MTALEFDSPVAIGLPDAPEAGTVIHPDNPVAVAIVLEGPQGVPGPQGPQGEPGEGGGGGGSDVTLDADGTLFVDGLTVELATDGQLTTEIARATTAEGLLAPKASPTFTGTVSGVTKAHVGLGNVDNTADASKPVSTATQTALDLKAPLASPTFTGTVAGVTKSHVGLGNVDNTSDANKPVSTATQTALDLKAPLASPTFTGTVAGITKSHVGLGNVDNTADTAKPVSTAQQTALDLKANLASPTFTGTVAGVTKSHVGLGNVDNTADTAKPVSTAQQTALDLKANLASPALTGTPTAPTATGGTNTTQVATTAFVAAAVSGGGVTLEQVYDALATVLVAGTNMTITPNDGADTITFAASGGGGTSTPTIDSLTDFNAVYGNTYTALDQEFDATSTSLPTGWSWTNQGSSSYRERFGGGALITDTTAGSIRLLKQSLTGAPSTWEAIAKLGAVPRSVDYMQWGIALYDGTAFRLFERALGNSGLGWQVSAWSGASTFGSVPVSTGTREGGGPSYISVKKNSSTSYDMKVSMDGIAWLTVATAYNPSLTPTHIGIHALTPSGGVTEVSCHWFRVR